MDDHNGYAEGDEYAGAAFEDMFDDDDGDVEGNESISEEDAWRVISSHFYERGLVSQQLDSFDVFMTNTMQVSYDSPQPQVHVLRIA